METEQTLIDPIHPNLIDTTPTSETPIDPPTPKPFYQNKVIELVSLGVFVLLLIGTVLAYNMNSANNDAQPSNNPSPSPTITPTLVPTTTPTTTPLASTIPNATIKPKATATPKPATPAPTPQPTPTPTPVPTPTPRTANPPGMTISYPTNNQSITMNNSQTLCMVDFPSSGDTSGLQRKHIFNTVGWTSYVDHYTLCLDPIEGQNVITVQYRNKYGDESQMQTIQFNFHRE